MWSPWPAKPVLQALIISSLQEYIFARIRRRAHFFFIGYSSGDCRILNQAPVGYLAGRRQYK